MMRQLLKKRRGRKFWSVLSILVAAPSLFVALCWLVVAANGSDATGDVTKVAHRRVALVLGCAPLLSGNVENPFFTTRMDAAVALFAAGKADYLLVSGDNHRAGYDEPTAMKTALIARGVPEARIVCDYAGFTTLDSVLRAKAVFGQSELIIVSQQFHNERALYLARANGVVASGFNAADVSGNAAFSTQIREIGARVRAIWDTQIARRKPKYLGAPVVIGAPASILPK